jgi:hypothetical protein
MYLLNAVTNGFGIPLTATSRVETLRGESLNMNQCGINDIRLSGRRELPGKSEEASVGSGRKLGQFLGILLFACPLMAQIGGIGSPVSDSVNVSHAVASSFLPTTAFPALGPAKTDDEVKGRKFYRWSVVAVVAGNAADAMSSWHHLEANPVLAKPGATFDTRSMALKAGFLGASLLIEHWALRHNPRLYRSIAWMNVAIAGGFGGVAAYNTSLH